MAGKKGNISNDEFIKQLLNTSQNAAKSEISNNNPKKIDEDATDEIQYIDFELMDDAPLDWNNYPRLKKTQPDKYLELKMSIYANGIQEPLILWKKENGRYMVLAGHNRRDVSREIYEECKKEKGFEERKFKFLPSIVKQVDEITEEQAQNIIDETNLQRDYSRLSEREKIAITKRRLIVYKKRRYAKGERIDQLAKNLGIKKSAIYDNIAIDEKIIPVFQDLYYDGIITRKAVLKFASFDKMTQQWMYEKYKEKINDINVKQLKKNMSQEEIQQLFETEVVGIKKLTIDVPQNRVEEFKKMFHEWLECSENP